VSSAHGKVEEGDEWTRNHSLLPDIINPATYHFDFIGVDAQSFIGLFYRWFSIFCLTICVILIDNLLNSSIHSCLPSKARDGRSHNGNKAFGFGTPRGEPVHEDGKAMRPGTQEEAMSNWNDPKYQNLSNAEISDALDFFGLPGSSPGLSCVTGEHRIFGPAFTVRFAPADPQAIGTVGDYIDDVQPGQVVVLDNEGRSDCTVWGGILSQVAQARNIAGTVINGVCRDSEEAVQCGYPIFSRGVFMRTGKDRVQVEAVGGSVSLGEVRVNPGDIVVGDRDGIVVIPAARADEVLERALKTHQTEKEIVQAVRAGATLKEAREKLGYHLLQRSEQPADADRP